MKIHKINIKLDHVKLGYYLCYSTYYLLDSLKLIDFPKNYLFFYYPIWRVCFNIMSRF